MEDSSITRNKHNELLGVNRMGKSIRKSPLHQPSFANVPANAPRPPAQPQVYNVSKNDFRSIVQQLTGSPSQELLPKPPQNPPKTQSMRLQKIRPPPLMPINRPPPVPTTAPPPSFPPYPQTQVPYGNNLVRPGQFGLLSPTPLPPLPDSGWSNTLESPISAYMRYLQSSIVDSGPRQSQPQFQSPQIRGQVSSRPLLPPPLPPTSGLLPNLSMVPVPSPRGRGPGLLPSPTSQFHLPSPTSFLNLSPRSPYPLLSPGIQYPPPLTPNFPFSFSSQPGILGPGSQPPPPPSPGVAFPSSPRGFFPIFSPRWKEK